MKKICFLLIMFLLVGCSTNVINNSTSKNNSQQNKTNKTSQNKKKVDPSVLNGVSVAFLGQSVKDFEKDVNNWVYGKNVAFNYRDGNGYLKTDYLGLNPDMLYFLIYPNSTTSLQLDAVNGTIVAGGYAGLNESIYDYLKKMGVDPTKTNPEKIPQSTPGNINTYLYRWHIKNGVMDIIPLNSPYPEYFKQSIYQVIFYKKNLEPSTIKKYDPPAPPKTFPVSEEQARQKVEDIASKRWQKYSVEGMGSEVVNQSQYYSFHVFANVTNSNPDHLFDVDKETGKVYEYDSNSDLIPVTTDSTDSSSKNSIDSTKSANSSSTNQSSTPNTGAVSKHPKVITKEIKVEYQPSTPGTPQQVQIYIQDLNHSISNSAETITITQNLDKQIELTLQEKTEGEYKVVRDGNIVDDEIVNYDDSN